MPISDIFSKRQRMRRGETPDVYNYDYFPTPLRVQIVHIIYDVLGNHDQYEYMNPLNYDYPHVREIYDFIADTLCREYGLFALPADYTGCKCKMNDLLNYFLQVEDIERAIDVVELLFRAIGEFAWKFECLEKDNAFRDADSAIDELNSRFKEHGLGYFFTNGQIIRIDSEFIHSEAVQPALRMLNQKRYFGAQQQFLSAHDHYRKGNAKEALNECLNSLEGVIKSICNTRKWFYRERATTNALIEICFENELLPSFLQPQFDALQNLLESGASMECNSLSSHGQGTELNFVQGNIVGYVLHLTAAAIVLLTEAEVNGKGRFRRRALIRNGIRVYSARNFERMSYAGDILAAILDELCGVVRPGITTVEINDITETMIRKRGAVPATIGYRGYKHATCISVNHVACHGIPGPKRLRNGDILNIDVTIIVDGWYCDSSRMYVAGELSRKAERLLQVTHDALMLGIAQVRPGNTFGDIGNAIQKHVEKNRMSVARDFCGHGIGNEFHLPPNVLHYGSPGSGPSIEEGMLFTIEPIVNMGKRATRVLSDDWTAVTVDKSLSAQFEHTVGVTAEGCEIFTLSPAGRFHPTYEPAGKSNGREDSLAEGLRPREPAAV